MAVEQRHELLGLFEEADQAADAFTRLREAGFGDADLEALSSTPYPEGAFGEAHVKHRLFTFPFAGAACGFVIGAAWIIGAQLSEPLITGGKPIVAVPAIIQILYEGTLLAAVLFTVIGVLFESRLPDGVSLYDRRIADGYIGVSVLATDQKMLSARQALQQAGAADIIAQEGSIMGSLQESTSS
jgi:hypothetical protein